MKLAFFSMMSLRKQRLIALGLLLTLPLLLAVTGWQFLYWGSLSIEAQIVYNMGGPQPVARQNFYLLNIDPFTLRAEDARVKLQFENAKSDTERQLFAVAGMQLIMLQELTKSDKLTRDNAKQFLGMVDASKPYWEGHLVQSVQTDFSGKAVFNKLRPGKYWLLGQSETRAEFALWNVPVKVGLGKNTLLLDQNNSVYSK